MKFQRKSILSAVWLTCLGSFALLLVGLGCGGGSGSPGGPGGTVHGTAATGKVILPVGFKLPLSQLMIVADNGQAGMSASGSFVVPVGSAGPRVVQLVDKVSGKIALLGYVDGASSGSPYAGGKGDVSTKSTADALLFMGLMGGAMPTQSWTDYLNDIRGSSEESQVQSAVAAAVVADSGAITDGDPRIVNAVGAIQSTYTGPSFARNPIALREAMASASPHKPAVSVQRVTVGRRPATDPAVTGALIKVEPGSSQSSLVIAPNPNGDGLVVISTSRRRGAIFVYKVGTGPSANQITPINPPQETFADVEIEPTLEIKGVINGLKNGLQGKFAYLPLKNPPILLQPDPVQEVAVYDVVAIGPGGTDTIPQIEQVVAPNSAAARAGYDKEWRAALLASRLKVLFQDIIEPVLAEMVAGLLEEDDLPGDAGLEGALTTASHAAPGFDASLAAGDLKGAAAAVLAAIEHNTNNLRTQIIADLAKKFVSSGKLNAASFQLALQNAAKAIAVMEIINRGITVVDVTQSFHDNRAFNTADNWVADVLQPIAKLIPQKSFVDTNDPLVKLGVTIQNVTDLSSFRFRWSNTATQGKLESSASTANLGTGIIPDSTAVYVTDFTKFQVGGVDTITVKIFSKDDLTIPLATVTGTITGAPAPCTTKPPAPVRAGKFPAIITFSEPATRPGDIFTVTVAFPADGGRDQDLEITLFSAPGDFGVDANKHEACKLLTVDGKPARTDTKDVHFSITADTVNNYHVASAAVAQTHVLVFQMKEPTDLFDNPTPYCSTIDSTHHDIPPYVEATGFGFSTNGFSLAFFNENP